jgi:hypothetical protein
MRFKKTDLETPLGREPTKLFMLGMMVVYTPARLALARVFAENFEVYGVRKV